MASATPLLVIERVLEGADCGQTFPEKCDATDTANAAGVPGRYSRAIAGEGNRRQAEREQLRVVAGQPDPRGDASPAADRSHAFGCGRGHRSQYRRRVPRQYAR